jgi:hypothetical protein
VKFIKMSLLTGITLLLILMVPLSLAMYSMNRTVLEPYSTNQYISDTGLQEELHELIEEQVEAVLANHSVQQGFEEILRSAVQTAVQEVVTPEWLNRKIEEFVTNFWDYLLGVTETIEPVELQLLKDTVIMELQKKLDEMAISEVHSKMIMNEIEPNIPLSLSITGTFPIDEQQLANIRDAYKQSQESYIYVLLTSLLLFIIGWITAFYPKLSLSWSGYTLGLIGIFMLLAALIFQAIPTGQVLGALMPASLPGDKLGILADTLFTEAVQEIIHLLWISIIAGFVLILFSYLPIISKMDEWVEHYARNPKINALRTILIILLAVTAGWMVYQFSV